MEGEKISEDAERWKDVPGFGGNYRVSDQGRVKPLVRQGTNGKAIKLMVPTGGHVYFQMRSGGKRHSRPLRRVVAEVFLGIPDGEGWDVCHLDGNPLNNRLDNLWWKAGPSVSGTKECTKCGEAKGVGEFYPRKRNLSELCARCKVCMRRHRAEYRKKNIEKYRGYCKKSRLKNIDKIKARAVVYQANNKSYLAQYRAARYAKNRDKIIAKVGEYRRRRKKTDPAFALTCRTRTLAAVVFRGGRKGEGFFRHMPYTKDELVARLLSTLPSGYTESDACDGRKLHIDHIRPVSSFKLTGEIDDEFLSCWALSNLQLLPASENLTKGNKWDG